MTEIARIPATDLANVPSEALRAELAKGLTIVATELAKMSMVVWAELESRGEDLSDLKFGINAKLPLIAAGLLAAEAVVAFSSRPHVLRAIEGMPLAVQRRLADGEPIPVYLHGEAEPKALPLARIPAAAVSRVIVDGVVRTPAEQRLAMRTKKRQAEPAERNYTVAVDRESRTIKIGKMTIPIATILAAMAEAAGARGAIIDTPEAPYPTIAGHVTVEEKERLKAAAKAHDMEIPEMVRQAVVAMWML